MHDATHGRACLFCTHYTLPLPLPLALPCFPLVYLADMRAIWLTLLLLLPALPRRTLSRVPATVVCEGQGTSRAADNPVARCAGHGTSHSTGRGSRLARSLRPRLAQAVRHCLDGQLRSDAYCGCNADGLAFLPYQRLIRGRESLELAESENISVRFCLFYSGLRQIFAFIRPPYNKEQSISGRSLRLGR